MYDTRLVALAVVGSLTLMAPSTAAQRNDASGPACLAAAGRGTGSSIEAARYHAWEAVLQATSWPLWATWIISGAPVGQAAAGYEVGKVRQTCGTGGALGKECIIRAKLCQPK